MAPLTSLPALPLEGPQTCSFRGASCSREASLGWADPTKQDYVILHGCHKVLRLIQISLSLPTSPAATTFFSPLLPSWHLGFVPSELFLFHPASLSGSLLWDLSNNSMPGNTEYCILLYKGMLVGKHDLNPNIRFKHCLL